MELKKFRIQNYKSIVDTECHINQNLTIFAGMNESGKTSILEAIRDFDRENLVNKDAKRVKGEENDELLISLYFRLNEEDTKHIYHELEMSEEEQTPSLKDFLLKMDIGIVKNIENEYSIDTDTALHIRNLFLTKYKECYQKYCSTLNELGVNESSYSDIYGLQEKIKEALSPRPLKDPLGQLVKDEIVKLLSQIENNGFTTFGYCCCEVFINDLKSNLLKIMPKIIFFSSFDDQIQYSVSIHVISKHQTNLDLCYLANIDIGKLKHLIDKTDYQGVENYLNQKSAKISGVFKREWSQDQINISFSSDKEIIHFGINENGDTAKYRADQRSKGFQWFLSFCIRLSIKNNRTKIILIDEPGLYLHAKAQDDVLKKLEKLSEEDGTCVLFTTHSPYLIDIDKLNRVLLVQKDDKNGTEILKVHESAVGDTLTPIMTKMGFDISKANFIREKNILVEGISDYYYIQAFKELLDYNNFFENISIIPAVGASEIPRLASFCIGWGLEYVALFDRDKEGKDNYNKIVKDLGDKASVSYIREQENCTIEDLFTKKDLDNLVKKHNESKALSAKRFYDNINNEIKKDSLERETIENFKKLFDVIFEKLNINKNKNAKS